MHLLGIDLGTSGTKAVLIDGDARTLASATREHPLSTPRPGWCEQDPEDWWRSACGAVREVLESSRTAPADVAAIGLAGQMHGLVLADGAMRTLRPCLLWNDQRSAPQCARAEAELGLDALLRHTGNRMLPGFTAPKILWCREHEPEVARAARMHLLPKDWLRWRLSGTCATEPSDASGTLLFDCARRRWSDEMLDFCGVARSAVPECFESPVASARLSAEAAAALGLRAGTPIVGGAGDQAAQAVGSGIVDEGEVAVTIGTSGVAFAASESHRPSMRGELHAFCHAAPDRWHVMGVMLSAGGSLRWYRDSLAPGASYDELVAEAAASPAGARGITFLPYLTGERCPHPDPTVRGAFLGLDATHRRADLTRAVLEGITFGLRENLELIRNVGVRAEVVRLSGGGARSAMWAQLCADAFGLPVEVARGDEGAAFGAALLAGVGGGAWESVASAASAASAARTRHTSAEGLRPGPDAAAVRRAAARFAEAYPLARAFASAAGGADS